jgi:hypothetical protein
MGNRNPYGMLPATFVFVTSVCKLVPRVSVHCLRKITIKCRARKEFRKSRRLDEMPVKTQRSSSTSVAGRRDFTGAGLHLITLSNKETPGEQNETGHRAYGWVAY